MSSELDAYTILVREFEPMVRGYVTALVRDRSLVEDIVQEAFLIAHRNLAALRKSSSFGPWIRSIARNAAWKELARRSREIPWDPEMIQGIEEVIEAFDKPDRGDDWHARAAVVKQCLDGLAEALREPCRLFYFDDQTTETIAEGLAIAPATARKRLERARLAIKDCVKQQLGMAACRT